MRISDIRAWPTRDLLSHRVAATPHKTAIIDAASSHHLTYAEFDSLVDQMAAPLVPYRDDRIVVLSQTRLEFAALVFAAMRVGATLVPLNVRETTATLASKCERVDPDAIVCTDETIGTARDIADCPLFLLEEHGIIADSDTNESTTQIEHTATDQSTSHTEPTATDQPSLEPVDLDRSTDALILFTSGTTGTPKGVRLTVGNLVASATASAFRLGVSPADRWLCCLPMYHMGGLAPVIRSTLYGTGLVVQRGFDAKSVATAIASFDITGVSLVPTMLRRMLESGWQPPASLRFVLLGGAPAPDSLLTRCEAVDVPVYPTYGTTETASQVATATPTDIASHPGTVGHPLQFTDVSIRDEDDTAVGPGTRGEVVVSGPTVSPGYLDPEQTAAAFDEHGFHTGDEGYRDESGRLWICGRLRERIVTGGENVDPSTVEATLKAHATISDAAVVSLEDPEWGERVGALVVPVTPTDPPSPEAIESHCASNLARFKVPKTIGVVEALPRTASGTVDRDSVRERLRADGIDVSSRDT